MYIIFYKTKTLKHCFIYVFKHVNKHDLLYEYLI